jgi:hypothetical protein
MRQYYLSSLVGLLVIEMVANWGKSLKLEFLFDFISEHKNILQLTIDTSTRTAEVPRQLYSSSSVKAYPKFKDNHC